MISSRAYRSEIGVGTDQGCQVLMVTNQGYRGYRSGSEYISGTGYMSEFFIHTCNIHAGVVLINQNNYMEGSGSATIK